MQNVYGYFTLNLLKIKKYAFVSIIIKVFNRFMDFKNLKQKIPNKKESLVKKNFSSI